MSRSNRNPQPNQRKPKGRSPPVLLTVSDVARMIRCSRKTVERLVARGELSFYELPLRRGALRFAERDICEWLTSHRHEADTE
jgi:excisionase family DNA binding protein